MGRVVDCLSVSIVTLGELRLLGLRGSRGGLKQSAAMSLAQSRELIFVTVFRMCSLWINLRFLCE